jgi:hypothetical protein
MAFFWVVVIRGGRNPLVVEVADKIAEAIEDKPPTANSNLL